MPSSSRRKGRLVALVFWVLVAVATTALLSDENGLLDTRGIIILAAVAAIGLALIGRFFPKDDDRP